LKIPAGDASRIKRPARPRDSQTDPSSSNRLLPHIEQNDVAWLVYEVAEDLAIVFHDAVLRFESHASTHELPNNIDQPFDRLRKH
jgi:hypothetical protein